MKKYSHQNWNDVLEQPNSEQKRDDLKLIGKMALHNFIWFVRQCVATDQDLRFIATHPNIAWRVIEPTEFTKRRRKMENEDSISKN